MKQIKSVVKKIAGFHETSGISTLNCLTYLGSKYHGYWIPEGFLNKSSVCYCVGAGDDISFDTEIKTRYQSQVYIFDPTAASLEHFQLLKELSKNNNTLPTVSQDANYQYHISFNELEEICFIEEGVWSEKTVLKFFDPELDNYVSHSVYLFKNSKKVIELPVNSIKNFMAQFGHQSIDLVKLEIEGAEYTVIDSILKDKADVKMILVEFDEIFHARGFKHLLRIRQCCNQLKKAGYVLVHSTSSLKRTFIRKDVYQQLRQKEQNLKAIHAF